MGTYTTNKNLFMPSVGETGWGELVNNNFSTIDTFLKPITVSGSTYTFTGNHVGNQSGGSVTATTGAFSGAVTGASFNGVSINSNRIGGFPFKIKAYCTSDHDSYPPNIMPFGLQYGNVVYLVGMLGEMYIKRGTKMLFPTISCYNDDFGLPLGSVSLGTDSSTINFRLSWTIPSNAKGATLTISGGVSKSIALSNVNGTYTLTLAEVNTILQNDTYMTISGSGIIYAQFYIYAVSTGSGSAYVYYTM